MNNEDEQNRLNTVTSLKELGEQVKELERTIHKDAGKDSQDGKMGNDFSKGVDSAVSIITGDITGGLAGASAPWLAEQIKLHTGHMGEDGKWQTDDIAGNLIAHAILGAVVAELQGNWKVKGQTVTGTNVERMAEGLAPIGTDGRPINLHHMTQKQSGPIAEVTQSFHQQNRASTYR